MMDTISFKEFQRLDLRVAKIKEAKNHPNADKLLILTVDLGEDGERQLVAGIKEAYPLETLEGMQIVIITNLEPAIIRGIESRGMLLAAEGEDGKPVLIVPHEKTLINAKIR